VDTGQSKPRILLTGRPGCGKTTVVKRAVELVGVERCAGFYTEEVRDRGRRVGFDVVTLGGERGRLARVGAEGPRVGRYGVDVASFEELGVGALEEGLREGAPVLVVDEIGKMELFSERFSALLVPLIAASRAAILGTIMAGRHARLDSLKRHSSVKIIEVAEDNRNDLPDQICRALSMSLEV
jgi:nucleoside-triphosphatase